MSWLNFSSVTPSSSGRMEWQSRQEFFAGACACAAGACWAGHREVMHTTSNSMTAGIAARILLCEMAINCHTCYVRQGKHSNSGDPLAGARGMIAFEERNQQP